MIWPARAQNCSFYVRRTEAATRERKREELTHPTPEACSCRKVRAAGCFNCPVANIENVLNLSAYTIDYTMRVYTNNTWCERAPLREGWNFQASAKVPVAFARAISQGVVIDFSEPRAMTAALWRERSRASQSPNLHHLVSHSSASKNGWYAFFAHPTFYF
jgi:hypothetical protein